MNILFNISPAIRPVTGIGTYAKELIKHLLQIDKGNHYILFSIKSPFPHRRIPFSYLEARNVSYKSITFPYRFLNILWNNMHLFPIEKFVGKVDVMHSLDKFAPFTKSAKIIITTHDMLWYLYKTRSESRGAAFRQIVESLKRSTAIIVPSEFSKCEMVRYLPFAREKISVISEGVSDRFRPIDIGDIPEEILNRYPWDDYILYIGMLDEPRKNVELLIDSYADLKKRKKIKEKLVLCGGVSKRTAALLCHVKELKLPNDIIVYSNWLPDNDIPYLYNKARIVLFPSLYEGFGLPVLESMACGKPVITSNISPLKEIASDAAILIDPRDKMALSDSIEMLLTDNRLYSTMAEKGLRRSKEFTWTKTAQETLKLYEKCQTQ